MAGGGPRRPDDWAEERSESAPEGARERARTVAEGVSQGVVDDALVPRDALDQPIPTEVLDDRERPRAALMVAPYFVELPTEARAELLRRVGRRRVPAGTLIVREGDPGDACFVVASGQARVVKRSPDGKRLIELSDLGPGELFGEFALLTDRRRHASVLALTEVRLYEIARRDLDELALSYSSVGSALEALYRERLLRSLIATAPFFRAVPEDERASLAERFHRRIVQPGEMVVEEGAKNSGFYLILLGSVDVTKQGVPRVLAHLGEGTYFGEMSLLSGAAASATVVATVPTELCTLSAADFYQLVAERPKLWETLRSEADRREQRTHQLVTGEPPMV